MPFLILAILFNLISEIVLNMRIESVQTSVYWGLAIMGLILAFATFIPSVLDFLKNLRRPSLTVEDVKLLISETLNSKDAKV